MGRKTNTIVAVLVALTCVTRSNGKRYADRSDQDLSTYFQPAKEDNIFVSGAGELAQMGGTGEADGTEFLADDQTSAAISPPKSDIGYTGYRRAAYKGNQIIKKKPPLIKPPSAKYDASSRYTTAFEMDTLSHFQPEPHFYSENANDFVPAKIPPMDAQPLKGILRKEPWPAKTAATKKVHFKKRVSVLFYDPRDGAVSRRPTGPIQKCADFGECSERRFKSTRTLRQGLRHLFYQ
jgi:hypothetical protein